MLVLRTYPSGVAGPLTVWNKPNEEGVLWRWFDHMHRNLHSVYNTNPTMCLTDIPCLCCDHTIAGLQAPFTVGNKAKEEDQLRRRFDPMHRNLHFIYSIISSTRRL
jgi:hypothetical protein